MTSAINSTFKIAGAEFKASYFDQQAMAHYTLPEIAFVGRSNVGKSSLLNALCHQNDLARVSKTPGRTQAINLFEVRFKKTADEQFLLNFIDLPGFGYAKVSKTVRSTWNEFVGAYFMKSKHLTLLLLLIDSRRGVGEEERWIAQQNKHAKLQIVLTKCDKLTRNEQAQIKRKVSQDLGIKQDQIIFSSILRGQRTGLEEIEQVIVEAVI